MYVYISKRVHSVVIRAHRQTSILTKYEDSAYFGAY